MTIMGIFSSNYLLSQFWQIAHFVNWELAILDYDKVYGTDNIGALSWLCSKVIIFDLIFL